jgi:hypothetical protein
MSHTNRSRRRANTARRERAAEKQAPLSVEDQRILAAANAKSKLRRYPHPPLYRLSYKHAEPVQPLRYQYNR